MKKLNKKEISKFTKKYLPDWINDISSVTMISYRGVKEYLVNGHYLVSVSRFKVVEKDLQ